jgi:2'-5' RNA ligase
MPDRRDPWLPDRAINRSSLSWGEALINAAARKALTALLGLVRDAIGSHGQIVNPDLLDTRLPGWRGVVETTLYPAVGKVFGQGFRDQIERSKREGGFTPDEYVGDYIAQVRNRLTGVADDVYDVIRSELELGRTNGESIPAIAARIDATLRAADAPVWRHRATVIARTETIGAYNAGRFTSGIALAQALEVPLYQVQKRWIDTDDSRTRPTHHAVAHGPGSQLPLLSAFRVGVGRALHAGDPTLPPEESVQCRCSTIILLPGDPGYINGLTASGEFTDYLDAAFAETPQPEDGQVESLATAVIVALPDPDDPVYGVGTEEKHITLAYLGSVTTGQIGRLALDEILTDIAAGARPIEAAVAGRAILGPDAAFVLLMDSPELTDIRNQLTRSDSILGAHIDDEETWPTWIPHVTLDYPDDADAQGGEDAGYDVGGADAIQTIRFDRLGLWHGDNRWEWTLGQRNNPEDDVTTPPISSDAPVTAAPTGGPDIDVEDLSPVPWHGIMAPEGVRSGDRRRFAAGSLRSRDLPLPLSWMPDNQPGHDGSIVVGRIDGLQRYTGDDGVPLIRAWGEFHTSDAADQAIHQFAERMIRGVSVDVDDASFVLEYEDGTPWLPPSSVEEMRAREGEPEPVMTVTDGRIAGATTCPIPAFQEAWVKLGEPPADWGAATASLAAAGTETVSRETGELVAAGEGRIPDQLGDYWVHGEGAAKIGWGRGGDFNRCRALLAEHVDSSRLSGLCANLHKRALGSWPGQEASGETLVTAEERAEAAQAGELHAFGEFTGDEESDCGCQALVASAASINDFADPQLDGPTRLTITPEGRVFGHLAVWGVCHIGMPGTCVTPPKSPSGYAYFATGTATFTDTTGETTPVPVGSLTIGTGHASPRARTSTAIAHYDNTGAVMADVAMGEDAHGIWFSGHVRDNAPPELIEAARRSGSVSGDWRTVGGQLELVAALVVNVPGFPIPAVAAATVGGTQTALVAAGNLGGEIPAAPRPADGPSTVSPLPAPGDNTGASPVGLVDLASLDRWLDRRDRAAAVALSVQPVVDATLAEQANRRAQRAAAAAALFGGHEGS